MEKSPEGSSNDKILNYFLKNGHESQSKAIAKLLSNTVLNEFL